MSKKYLYRFLKADGNLVGSYYENAYFTKRSEAVKLCAWANEFDGHGGPFRIERTKVKWKPVKGNAKQALSRDGTMNGDKWAACDRAERARRALREEMNK